MRTYVTFVCLVTTILGGVANALSGQLTLGAARAAPGQTVTLPVTYDPGTGRTAVALGSDIRFRTGLTNPRCAPGRALSKAGKTVRCAEPKPGLLRLVVFGLNVGPIPAGELALVTFDIAPGMRARSYRLQHTTRGADANGKEFGLRRRSGTIIVGR